MEKYLSREEVKTIINQAPKGSNPESLIKGLVSRGYTLQGLNDQPKEVEKPNTMSRLGTDLLNRAKTVGEQFKQIGEAEGAVETTAQAAQTPLRVVGQAAGAVGDVIGAGVNAATGGGLDKLGEYIATTETGKQLGSLLSKLQQEQPEIAGALGDLFNIATVGVGGAGAKTLGKAVLAGGEKALAGTGKVASGVAKGTKAVGEKLYQSAITPTAREAELILASKASRPSLSSQIFGTTDDLVRDTPIPMPRTRAVTALEKGIAGTETQIGVKAKKLSDNLWKKTIAPALDKAEGVVTKDELFAPIISRIEGISEPSRKKAFQEAFDALQEDYKDITQFSLKEAQNVKSSLDEFTPSKVFKGQEVANEFRMLQNDMANAIRQKIYNSIEDIDIKQAYRDYGNLVELQKIGVKAISETGLKGGFGGFWSTIWDTATTPIKTIGGKTLYKVGDKLQFTGDKGIKTFGEFLEKNGYKRSAFESAIAPALVAPSMTGQERQQ
jgi:hypothetical protein